MWYHHFDDQRHLWKMNISSFLIFLASLLLPLLPIASVFCPWLYKEDSAKSKKTNKSIQRCLMVSTGRISTEEIAPEKSSFKKVMLRVEYFYEAPIVRFYYYVISFFGFLILFSYVLLVDYFPLNRSASEGGIPWNWQLLRDVFNWGIWKIFGQVAEPYRDSSTDMDVVSGTDTCVLTTTIEE
ncbi:unnamed protein product [Rotaria sordida]|nr:unnamed protein product [Rotaria sordida]